MKDEPRTPPQPQQSGQSPNCLGRHVGQCGCNYQKREDWGYQLLKWIGGKKSWEHVLNASKTENMKEHAAPFERVLIRCNGCGKDMLREY